jgi:signal transduction histidine kinase/CheY-like chemotaxis protein
MLNGPFGLRIGLGKENWASKFSVNGSLKLITNIESSCVTEFMLREIVNAKCEDGKRGPNKKNKDPELFRNVLNSPESIPIASFDTHKNLTGFNKAFGSFVEFLDCKSPKLNQPIFQKNINPVVDLILEDLDVMLNKELSNCNKVYRVLDSTWCSISFNLLSNDAGEVFGASMFVFDISKQKKQNNELRRIRAIALEAEQMCFMGSWFCFHDEPLQFSPNLKALINQIAPDSSAIVSTLINRASISDKAKLISYFNPKDASCNTIEFSLRKDNGTLRYFRALRSSLKARRSGEQQTIGVIQDISQHKYSEIDMSARNQQVESAQKEAQRSALLVSTFLKNMSHEIRTPLNAILGFSQLLNQESSSLEELKKFSGAIQKSSNQLMKIVNDVLEMSQLESRSLEVKMDWFEITKMIEIIRTSFKDELIAKNLKFEVFIPEQFNRIRTDQKIFERILYQIIENAIKYTSAGRVEVKVKSNESQYIITVNDTGIGISNGDQQNIFGKFYKSGEENAYMSRGLGLGLSMASQYCDLLGGSIDLIESSKSGSTFEIRVPYHGTPGINHIEIEADLNQSVLVAEDEDINFLVLEMMLNKLYPTLKVIRALNGLEAIEKVRCNLSIGLVLMDINMPEMNGLEATKLIKQENPVIPIVAQTAYSGADYKEQAIAIGCDGFLTKPISKTLLHKTLEPFVSKKQSEYNPK